MINKFFDKAAGTELEQFLLGVADLEFKSYFFADCSRLAYHDGRVAKKYFKRVGFTTHKFFDVEGAQCHIAQTKEIIIISFRGTEPKEFSDVKADLNAWKGKSRTEGMVHKGFKGELDKLWADIKVALQRIGDRKLYICGHSLGGAMATICASRLEGFEPELYTYGSPRVGGRKFIKSFLTSNRYRFRNNNDIVTRVPFEIFGYKHVSGDGGKFIYFDVDGNVSKRFSRWYMFKQWIKGTLRGFTKLKVDGFSDHSIEAYYNFCRNEMIGK